jgi:tol-pal system protein YbgF
MSASHLLGRNARLFLVAVAAWSATACVSTQDIESIQSQIGDVQRQIMQMQMQAPSKTEVETLGSRISQQRDSLVQSEADMQLRLEALSRQIEQLEAKLEDTNFRLANLSQQIAATNQELKAFRNLPRFAQPAYPPSVPGGDSSAAAGTSTDPQGLYNNAYDDYVRGSYDLAIQQFREYLETFPDTEFSDNAAYWIGECYYRQSRFRQAINEFDRVLDRYPNSDKVPSALLKKGYAYLEQNDRARGVAQLQYVVREYPSSDEARLARQRLQELGVDSR